MQYWMIPFSVIFNHTYHIQKWVYFDGKKHVKLWHNVHMCVRHISKNHFLGLRFKTNPKWRHPHPSANVEHLKKPSKRAKEAHSMLKHLKLPVRNLWVQYQKLPRSRLIVKVWLILLTSIERWKPIQNQQQLIFEKPKMLLRSHVNMTLHFFFFFSARFKRNESLQKKHNIFWCKNL